MKGNSTLKYIANEMGISVSTVSRALNGKSVVKEETRKKVMEMAKKYAYVPNEVARSLQKSATETVAVVLPDISESFFSKIVKELESVMVKHGYMIILADTHERPDKEKKYLEMLYRRRVDALVLATVDCSGESVSPFIAAGIPVVFIDNIPELADADVITVNNINASKVAVEYLVGAGHRKIATIIGSKTETTGIERLEGYRQAIEQNHIEYNEELVAFGDYKMESGYEEMKKLIENREKDGFTAVYVTSEKMTYGALRAIREKGLKVPDDLSVIGFDIHNMNDEREKMITTVCQPEEEIGKRVGELLLSRLKEDNDNSSGMRLLLEPYIAEGDTVKFIK